MTNAQKWVAAFWFVPCLILLGRLTQRRRTYAAMMDSTNPTISDVDGLTLIKQTGCISCHGDNLQGSKLAPVS